MPALPPLPASLGRQVTTRDFNLLEMVARAWGGEFSAPDHRVYCFGNGVRCFDSTDLGTTGIYQRGVSTATAPILTGTLFASYVNLSWTISTIVGSDIVSYALWRSDNGGAFVLLKTVVANDTATSYSYQDFAIVAGHTYQYYVIGQPQAPGNNSAASNTVTEIIPNPPPPSVAFMAVGHAVGNPVTAATPVIATRGDGLSGTWTAQSATVFGNNGLIAVGHVTGQWFVGSNANGANAKIGTSADSPISFGLQTNPWGATRITCCVNGGGTWVAAGDGNQVMTSPDGVTWTTHVPGIAGSFVAATMGVAYGAGKFVLTGTSSGSAVTAYSLDGANWTVSGYLGSGSCVIYDGSQFVLITFDAGSSHRSIVTSPDGINYTVLVDLTAAGYAAGRYIAFNGTRYVLAAAGTTVRTATTLSGLAGAATTTVSTGTIASITASPTTGLFVVVCQDGTAFSSSDGVTWNAENPGVGVNQFETISFANTGAAVANLIIRSTAGAQIADVAAGGAPGDQIKGDFSTLISQTPQLYFKLFDSGPDLIMQAFCSIGQLAFRNIQVLNNSQTYTAASAAFVPGCGFNQWTWAGRAIGITSATVYNMVIA